MKRHYNTIVIGAGISGLTAAWHLKRAGCEVTLLEKEKTAGGVIKTSIENGWLIEIGPNTTQYDATRFDSFLDALGIQVTVADPASRKRYILRNRTLHALPMSPGQFIKTPLWSFGAKIRLFQEPFIGRGSGDESIAEFFGRRIGRELVEYAVDPFISGVYAGDVDQLQMKAAFPLLHSLEQQHGSLVAGFVKRRKSGGRSAGRKLVSFTTGMSALPGKIAESLGEAFVPSSRVSAIRRNGSKFVIEYSSQDTEQSVSGESVVLATAAGSAAQLIESIDPELGKALGSIPYAPVASLFLGFKESQLSRSLDGFGFLVPSEEKRDILGAIWSSSLFQGRAPEGHVAVTAFFGGVRNPQHVDLGDEELLALAVREMHDILGVKGDPVFSRISRWKRAIPQYTRKQVDAIAYLDVHEPRGMYLCGSYRGGVAVSDCLISGEATAIRVREYLATQSSGIHNVA